MARKAWVKVPGSSGNLGSGFDVAAAALGIYFELEIEVVSKAQGETLDRNNLVIATALPYLKKRFPKNGFRFRMQNGIPLERGLGSSAAARLAAICAAKLLGGEEPRETDWVQAAKLEGHPDNAAASFHGGLCASWRDDKSGLRCASRQIPTELAAVVCVPDFKLATAKARRVLPAKVSLEDAVFNLGRVAALWAAFDHRRYSLLRSALEDRLHQPYRKKLIPGFENVVNAALKKGAHGACLSGAGSSILAITERKADLEAIGAAMQSAFKRAGIASQSLHLPFDNIGIKFST